MRGPSYLLQSLLGAAVVSSSASGSAYHHDQTSGALLPTPRPPTVVQAPFNGDFHHHGHLPETESIQPIDRQFLEKPAPGASQLSGAGIYLDATGEPKSGTTWLGRIVPQIALELCGSQNNKWCLLGGLEVHRRLPAPWYEFEMLNGTASAGGQNPTLFLHFRGQLKHPIPGMSITGDNAHCRLNARPHVLGFADEPPCLTNESPTRDSLNICLWDTAFPCINKVLSTDPAVRRTFVIMRDPRDVVTSEFKMRTEVYKTPWVLELSLEEYVQHRFEVLVSWIHQRWMWHTSSVMTKSSHIVYYEDVKASHLHLIDMAGFMGLSCSPEQALNVWLAHQTTSIPRHHSRFEQTTAQLAWMNNTMARLLPLELVRRWEVGGTHL